MLLLLHILDIATGLGAGLIVVLFLYVLGFAAMPARLRIFKAEKNHAAVVGAAISVLWLWYAFRLAIPLTSAVLVLVFLTGLAALLKARSIAAVARGMTQADVRALRSFVALFGLFYVLSYFFLTPPVSSTELPITRLGNNDILNYFVSASYLQRLGPSNIADYSFVDAPSMILTFIPATYDALIAVAALFGGETIRATMPTMFCVVALIGCVMTGLARFSFRLSTATAAIITALVISGPFFRYIIGHYFLSTFVAELFLLLMMSRTAVLAGEPRPQRFVTLMLWFAPYHVLLFYSYPPLYVIGVGLQFGFAFLCNLLSRGEHILPSLRSRDLWIETGKWAGMLVASSALVWIIDPWHYAEIFGFLTHIASKGVGGWSLGLISPLAMIALPVPNQVSGSILIVATLLCFLAMAIPIVVVFARDHRHKYPPSGTALLAISALTFLAYFVYYARLGPSYQQWKIASYLPMVFAFALVAAICCVWSNPAVAKPGRTRGCFIALCLTLLAANMLVHAFKRKPLDTFDAKYANLRALEAIGDAKDISIQMASFSSTFFPVYYVRTKTLHLISPSYFPEEALDARTISASKPLFVEGAPCEPDRQGLSIQDVGCLHTSPPGLRPDRPYLFTTAIPGLMRATGFSLQESSGKQSSLTKVQLALLLDRDASSLANNGYINFDMRAFPAPAEGGQGLSVKLGNGKTTHGLIATREWISLPLRQADLDGQDSRELAVEFDLPESASASKTNAAGKPGIELFAMSVTSAPAGRLLAE